MIASRGLVSGEERRQVVVLNRSIFLSRLRSRFVIGSSA
jgi:hypothetical protein